MARSLLQDWCRGLDVDVHRALLVTGIPEGLEPAAIEAVLQPAFRPLGTFRLRSTRAVRGGKARAALVEFLEDMDPAAIPSEIRGGEGAWRVLCRDREEDTRVLRQLKRLLRDERVPGATPTAPAAEAEAREAGPPPPGAASRARKGRRSRRSRARGRRLAQRGRKRGRGGRPFPGARRGSEDSSSDSLGLVVEELDEEALGGLDAQRALYTTLQVAARELVRKWALQGDPEGAGGPREFLALVTVTDKAKKEELEKETPGAESISLNIEDLSGVPDLVALLAVRDTWDEEPVGSNAWESESQASGDHGPEGGHPEFVAIVAYTDPVDPSAREEMLKIASVIESLGWSDRKEQSDALPEVLSVMSKDARGARVQVQEAGRQVDALVLRKAKDDGNLLECISTLAEPGPLPRGKPAPRRLLGGWGDEEEGEVGLLELVALLAARDMAEGMKEGKEGAWEGGKCRYHKGGLGELLALLAAREDGDSEEESESEGTSEGGSEETSEDTESEASEPEDRASRKPRAKRARTASKVLCPAGAPSGSRKTRRGGRGRGDRGNTPEKKAKEEAAGDKKKKTGRAGARAKAGEARGQPSTGSKPARGRKARRGGRLAPKCR
ncbi:paraneoplastic antigen-like protein 8B [Myotis myotis]|uniref:PNMA family member 8B n=1 Tax=Myotis myotis TaxID=51298 RepID=A0A7J7R983_MYOMY|nr:paraneoplastic antigen-like protein 8B [Myotis myotis]KAF6272701.1 PNMA family member 8B [Myotis myotis]